MHDRPVVVVQRDGALHRALVLTHGAAGPVPGHARVLHHHGNAQVALARAAVGERAGGARVNALHAEVAAPVIEGERRRAVGHQVLGQRNRRHDAVGTRLQAAPAAVARRHQLRVRLRARRAHERGVGLARHRAEPADAHHRRAHGPRGEEPASGNRLHTYHPLNNKLDVSRETLRPSVRSAESGTNTRFGRKFLLLFGE